MYQNDDLFIKHDEFCITNDEFCIKNDELFAGDVLGPAGRGKFVVKNDRSCIQMMNVVLKMMNCALKTMDFVLKMIDFVFKGEKSSVFKGRIFIFY